MSDLNISVESYKRAQLLTVSGRIDSSNATEFDNKVKECMENGHNLVMDLSGVSYMSSAGLRAIVSALRECKKKKGDVLLVSPSARVAEVLSLAGLDSLFTVYDDATSAVGSF